MLRAVAFCARAYVKFKSSGTVGKNRLHPGIQSAIDGEQLGLRPFKDKRCVP